VEKGQIQVRNRSNTDFNNAAKVNSDREYGEVQMVKERIYIAKPIVDNPLLERLDSATIIAWFRCNSCLTCRFREKVIDVDKKKDIHWCSRTHQSANFINMVEFLGYSKE
jgi:hypothetical protein